MYFSPSRKQWLNVGAWSDSFWVEPEVYTSLMALVGAGTHTLEVDENNYPIAVPNPPPEPVVIPPEEAYRRCSLTLMYDFENAVNQVRGYLPSVDLIFLESRIAEATAVVNATEGVATPQLDAIWSKYLEINPSTAETKITVATKLLADYQEVAAKINDLTAVRLDAEVRLKAALAIDADAVYAVSWDLYVPPSIF